MLLLSSSSFSSFTGIQQHFRFDILDKSNLVGTFLPAQQEFGSTVFRFPLRFGSCVFVAARRCRRSRLVQSSQEGIIDKFFAINNLKRSFLS